MVFPVDDVSRFGDELLALGSGFRHLVLHETMRIAQVAEKSKDFPIRLLQGFDQRPDFLLFG